MTKTIIKTNILQFFTKIVKSNKIKKDVLFIGLNDKELKKQIISNKKAYSIICKTLKNQGLDGFTISSNKGVYIHENGDVTEENTYKVEIVFATDNQINNIIEELKRLLNQETILKETYYIKSVLQ